MSTITKQWLQQKIADMEATRDEIPFGLDEDDSNTLAALRIALASHEAEAVCVIDQPNLDYLKSGADADVWPASRTEMGDVLLYRASPPAPANAEPVAWLWSHRKHPSEVSLVRPEDDERAEGAHWSGWSCQALYAVPPAPVSVPDLLEQFAEFMAAESIKSGDYPDGWQCKASNAAHEYAQNIHAAMLQGAEPVTTKDDGGRYEQDDSPECGWVVTHSGKDYFYREQKDAVTHMNSAVESGLGVSLRSFIPEPVTTANKLPDGWVACSERMPERMVDVITSNGVDTGKGWWDGDNWKEWHKYDAVPGKITHWMPMPEAPQQEVKSGD